MPARPYRYWPCYCEENVWHLCAEPEFEARDPRVVFISNPGRQVALWGQGQAQAFGLPVIWDYHVLLLARSADGWEVLDLDSVLGLPVTAETYLTGTFPMSDLLPGEFAPCFRVLMAADYRRELRTDRRHMVQRDGTYLSPPPTWPTVSEGSNLMRFVNMKADFLGEVHALDGLRRWLKKSRKTA